MCKTVMDTRAAVLLAKYDEEKAKTNNQPYSEAVIAACELFLAITFEDRCKMYIELSQPHNHILESF